MNILPLHSLDQIVVKQFDCWIIEKLWMVQFYDITDLNADNGFEVGSPLTE